FQQFDHRELRLPPAEPGITAVELPCVNVADRHELSEPTLPLDAGAAAQRRLEDPGAPAPVELAPAIGDLPKLGNVVLLGQHLHDAVAHLLVVVDKDPDRARGIPHRRALALRNHPGRLALTGRGHEPVAASEPPDHGLHRDTGAPRDLVQRELTTRRLPEDFHRRVENPLSRGSGGLGASLHAVRTTRRCCNFHVTHTNTKFTSSASRGRMVDGSWFAHWLKRRPAGA